MDLNRIKEEILPLIEKREGLEKEKDRLIYLLQIVGNITSEDLLNAQIQAEEQAEQREDEYFTRLNNSKLTPEEEINRKELLKSLKRTFRDIQRFVHPDQEGTKNDPSGKLAKKLNALYNLAKTLDEDALEQLRKLCNNFAYCNTDTERLKVLESFERVNEGTKSEIIDLKMEVLLLSKIKEILENSIYSANTFSGVLNYLEFEIEKLNQEIAGLNKALLEKNFNKTATVTDSDSAIAAISLNKTKSLETHPELETKSPSDDLESTGKSEIKAQEVPKNWEEFKLRLKRFFKENNMTPNFHFHNPEMSVFYKGSVKHREPGSVYIHHDEFYYVISVTDNEGKLNGIELYPRKPCLVLSWENDEEGQEQIRDLKEAYEYTKDFFKKYLYLDFK